MRANELLALNYNLIYSAFSMTCPVIFFTLLSLYAAAEDIRCGKVYRIAFVLYAAALFVYTVMFNVAALPGMLLRSVWALILYAAVRIVFCGKMGFADVWYAASAAAVLPFFLWNSAMIAGCFFALVYCFILRLKHIRFIPFMAAGSFLVLILNYIAT